MRALIIATLALACAAPVRPPSGVVRVAGVCGGAIVAGRALTAAHCVSDRETALPVLSATGLQAGDLSALDDSLGQDLAWIWLGYDPGPSLELGGPPVVGQTVRAWLASDGDWTDGRVLSIDRRWSRARLSVRVRHGDSGSPVVDTDGRLVCILVGYDPRTGQSECSWAGPR